MAVVPISTACASRLCALPCAQALRGGDVLASNFVLCKQLFQGGSCHAFLAEAYGRDTERDVSQLCVT